MGEGPASGYFLHCGFQASSCLGVGKYPSIQYTCAAVVPMDLSYSNAFKEQITFVHFPSKSPRYTDWSLSMSPLYFYAWDLRNRHTLMGSAGESSLEPEVNSTEWLVEEKILKASKYEI